MKSLMFCFAMLPMVSVFAQSKKELQKEITRLNAEAQLLKGEVEKLKKPTEPQLISKHEKASYGLGVLVASNLIIQTGDSLVLDNMIAGIKDIFKNQPLQMQQQECLTIVQQYIQEVSDQKTATARAGGEAFLIENKTKEGVITTATGLQYKKIITGTGKSPKASDNVTVHYTGKLIDETVFDSSVERGEPATFGVSQVIAGWTEALQLMREGDKWILYIPYTLGYGERGAGSQIPPYSTLIFEVELIKVN